MWFESWYTLWRIAVSGSVCYTLLVVYLRISGKRTLSSLNAFDFAVTVAIGSVLATTMTASTTAIASGAVALALLVALQYVVAFCVARFAAVGRIVKSRPTVLVLDGEVDEAALLRERVAVDEVREAVRKHGLGGLEAVGALVLETDGSLSVIPVDAIGSRDALQEVTHPAPHH